MQGLGLREGESEMNVLASSSVSPNFGQESVDRFGDVV